MFPLVQHIAFSCPIFRAEGENSCKRKEEKVKAFVSSFVIFDEQTSLSVTMSCDCMFQEGNCPSYVQMFMYIHSVQVFWVACVSHRRGRQVSR